ncbi:Deoxynucleoside triphosphate triphosphohydrolase SAMHD1 [Thelohanellus kitauei]|uniref:Deoxynucleoside triphosphate triphosphohydrolase SAMHD1 n=1 Tax=Thelohanellus kitauei TaxID=669202 RepID=A0A0C2N1U9_THEKT|nr:Deoxynucleoside triphosphate triphosphohydrolase SAMHD1 [Thelohanellus kitauei]
MNQDRNVEDHLCLQDNIHGQIKLPILVKVIIDTPHFQRLRRIKQLGLASHVFINATHTRFEHCIGTAFVTSELIKSLKRNSEYLNLMTPQEEICLIVGGLCHDLGHGSFSHFYSKLAPHTWTHEEMSLRMFDDLLKSNPGVMKCFGEHNLSVYHISLIKSIIIGEPFESFKIPTLADGSCVLKKSFLLQIVSNHCHGIDTDKIDYLKRDSMVIGLPCSFEIQRLLGNMAILKSSDELVLCFKNKLLFDCNEVFHSRWSMQKNVYRHRTILSIELMLAKALRICDDIFHFATDSFVVETFMHHTDEILRTVEMSKNPLHAPAKAILKDITTRNLMKLGGSFLLSDNIEVNLKNLDSVKKNINDRIHLNYNALRISQLDLDIVEYGFQSGSHTTNPLGRLDFFKKHERKPFNVEMTNLSPLIPKLGIEKYLVVFYQTEDSSDHNVFSIEEFLNQWWEGYSTEKKSGTL